MSLRQKLLPMSLVSWDKGPPICMSSPKYFRQLMRFVKGWTIFDKLYLLNGTLYVVSDDPSKIPDRDLMISTGAPIENGPVEEAKRVPTDRDMQIITPQQAKLLFGSSDAELIDGVTVS